MLKVGYKPINNVSVQKQRNERSQITQVMSQTNPSFTSRVKLPKPLLATFAVLGIVGGSLGVAKLDKSDMDKRKEEGLKEVFANNLKHEKSGKIISEKSMFQFSDYQDYIRWDKTYENAVDSAKLYVPRKYVDKLVEAKSSDVKKIMKDFDKELLNKVTVKILNSDNYPYADFKKLKPEYKDSVVKFSKELVSIIADDMKEQTSKMKENVEEKLEYILKKQDKSKDIYSEISDVLEQYSQFVLDAPMGVMDLKYEKKKDEKIKNALKTLYKEVGVKTDDKEIDKMIKDMQEKKIEVANEIGLGTKIALLFGILGSVGAVLTAIGLSKEVDKLKSSVEKLERKGRDDDDAEDMDSQQ